MGLAVWYLGFAVITFVLYAFGYHVATSFGEVPEGLSPSGAFFMLCVFGLLWPLAWGMLILMELFNGKGSRK